MPWLSCGLSFVPEQYWRPSCWLQRANYLSVRYTNRAYRFATRFPPADNFLSFLTFYVFSDRKALEAIDKKGMDRVPNFCVNRLFCLASKVDGVSKGSLQRYVRTHLNLPSSFCGFC